MPRWRSWGLPRPDRSARIARIVKLRDEEKLTWKVIASRVGMPFASVITAYKKAKAEAARRA